MFDFVCNHMSAKSEWFKNYLQQQPGFEDFFIAVDPKTDLSAVTRPRALPLLTPFQMRDHSMRHLWTTFSDDQIDLNYRSPEVLLAMVDVLLCYLERAQSMSVWMPLALCGKSREQTASIWKKHI